MLPVNMNEEYCVEILKLSRILSCIYTCFLEMNYIPMREKSFLPSSSSYFD